MSEDWSEPQTKTGEVRSPTPPVLLAPADALDRRDDAWRIAIDRGGTFTDVVGIGPRGRVVLGKVPTDAGDAVSDAAIDAIRTMTGAPARGPIPRRCVSEVRCGTTAATNALLERRGERCALLVTKGFRDLLTIGTQERPDLFALHVLRTLPLPEAVYEIDERILADGTVRTPLDEDAVLAAGEDLRARGIRAVAVVFLHAYAHPGHEDRVRELLGPQIRIVPRDAPGPRYDLRPPVFVSHESARELGAVARGETTAADAYLTPVLRRSLARFRAAFAPDVDVKFMRSDGGLSPVDGARGPAAVLSGPAGGALAVEEVAREMKLDGAIGFDMGGTSTDVCRAAPEPERRYETRIAGFRLRVPALRVHTVAAGGGSILAFDGRRLLVGPESAGAHPGPAGYGRGGPPTVTDADAVLGRLVPSEFPACFGADGTRPFDVEASRRAIEPLAKAAGLSVEEAAAGFVRVADELVAQAIREESVLRGYDVRTHALVAFGGAGPQHACAVARALGVGKIIVPRLASVLSASGIAGARESREWVHPILAPLDERARSTMMLAWGDAGQRADRELGGGAHDVRTLAELRVRGTEATLVVPAEGTLADIGARFRAEHLRAYGFTPPAGAAIEVVNLRVRVEERRRVQELGIEPVARTKSAERNDLVAWFVGPHGPERVLTGCFDLGGCVPGAVVDGPALLVGPATTVVVEPGWRVTADPMGPLVMERVTRIPPPRITAERDPVSLTLFANAFMAVAERMGAVLERTSHSTNIKERLDFSCAVFDGEGRLVANAPHIPVHLGAMGESVRAVIAARTRGAGAGGVPPAHPAPESTRGAGAGGVPHAHPAPESNRGAGGIPHAHPAPDLHDGDCIVTNDPYRGGSHLPDVTVVTPVLVTDGRAAFFVANRAHHADVGGITPGSMPPMSRSIDEEGVRLHDLLLVRDGAFREDEIRAALSAGPYPARSIDERLFDFRAQAAANAEGARLVREMCDLHDEDVVASYMGHVQDDGAAAFEEVLRDLPEGTHVAEDTLDDGTPLRVAVTVADGRATVDFAGTGPQSAGNLNAPFAVVRAAVLYAFRTLVKRSVPLNEGCLRPLTIVVPPGSLLDPRPPAAVVGGNVETSQRIVDLVLRAVGACAASQGTMNNVTFGTPSWTYYETLAGGTGAGPAFDGASAVQCHMTNTRITDVEVLERLRPVVVRRFEVRRGSGGGGARRGGDGVVREIEFLADVAGGVLSERRARGAPGLAGGGDGAPGRNVLVQGGVETVLPGRAAFEARAGDALRVETPGGGGWGEPPPEPPADAPTPPASSA